MQDNNAVTLLGYLYDQIDMLATLGLDDGEKVDAACRINKAVNDTSRSIMDMARLSIEAIGKRPTLGTRNLLTEFFDDGSCE